ncbi:uncharacterized protein F5891DRAFT_1173357 [Suillus fuscotomentosus]|uniref:DUF6532 domain-containing protein n=1 Tax=Suillus fuscotomentosus TaxID=1912939 RepID=A0AAD4E5M3_9AGAM|nr:uncharacterized protein F5891DRAFT_1173357 [Suillus fuscotomentosus]KAG1900007.1 hypothetical protein F5891DRAFT_1173357 [Suillus fuscotomentosus]
MPPRPSEIAAQKRNAKKKEKVAARQVSSGAEVVTPDIADDITDSKLQRSSKKKALERKVWNDTTSNNRKRAPTVTELLSAPATKSVRKTLKAVEKTQKAVEGGGRERSSVASTLTSHNGVSVDTDDSASEYGISDSESNKSDVNVEVEDDSDISDLLSKTPENLHEIPRFVPPCLASRYSDSSAAASTWDDDDPAGQLVTVTADSVKVKCEPDEKKKRSKLEGRQQIERPQFAQPSHDLDDSIAVTTPGPEPRDTSNTYAPFKWPEFTNLVYEADGSINLKAQNTRPEGRLSAFRTGIKKLAHQIVVSRFALRRGCSNEVEELLKSHKYIFPTNQNGKVLGDQPFCDEAMIDTLHQSLFDGENSIGVQSHEDFVSVLDGNDEPELPIAMVALIATVIYAILMDWRSGNPPSSSQVKSFNATVYISVYKAHEATLTRIFEGGKKKYHALMARLYKAVCVSDNVLLPSGALSNFDYLDLSAMSED